MSETTRASRTGSQFGPYHLKRLLGRGGMGEVYEAEDTVKDRVVALKLMTAEFSSDPVFRQRMQREAHTAGKLQEPHVVPIHDYGEIDGQLYIDMRFVEGTDVSALLNRHGPLPPPRAVAIIRQIADALDAAHAAGVMHRDVKPENILITGNDFAYLVDFGIAAAATDQHLTQTGSAIGTWNYMAPERFSSGEVTYRADIYALACVLHECLTGATPYQTDSLSALMAAHLMQPIPRPSRQRPGIPAAFDEVIARGMAKDPANRYAKAGDLALAAHQALSAPQQHQSATLLEHSQQSAPPAPAADRAPWTQPPPPQPWPPRSARTRNPWLVLGAAALVVIAVLGGLGIWLATRNTGGGLPVGSGKTTTSTTTTIPTIPPARMDSILLNAAEIDTIMGTSDMQASETTRKFDDTPKTLSSPDCVATIYSGQTSVYQNSGYTAVTAVGMTEPNNDAGDLVMQVAVAFPSADQAGAFLTSSAAQWRTCAGQAVTETQGGQTATWTVGNLTEDAQRITQLDTRDGGPMCQHVMSAVSNVIVDATACGPHISDEASRIADKMAANAAK